MRKTGPTLITLALSGAAVCGYLVYRFTASPGAPSEAEAEAPALADALPAFTLADLDGTATPLSSFAGQPLVINFWATWCAPCLREIPMLKTFQAEHPDLTVIGIAVDRLDPVLEFAAEMDFNYPVLVGQSDAMDAAASFGVDFFALPFTVFADAEGHVLGVHTGEVHPEHLENLTGVLADLDGGTADLAAARARIAGLQ
jgi:thiol-disulfide isomerase/thioredoxin